MYSLSFTIVRVYVQNINACINVYVAHVSQLCVVHEIFSHRLIFDVVQHIHKIPQLHVQIHANEKGACVERFFSAPILRQRYISIFVTFYKNIPAIVWKWDDDSEMMRIIPKRFEKSNHSIDVAFVRQKRTKERNKNP